MYISLTTPVLGCTQLYEVVEEINENSLYAGIAYDEMNRKYECYLENGNYVCIKCKRS